MKNITKLVSIATALVLMGAGCSGTTSVSSVTSEQAPAHVQRQVVVPAPSSPTLFTNSELHFQVTQPMGTDSKSDLETTGYIRDTFGRIGNVSFTQSGSDQLFVNVYVYSDKAKLEQELSSYPGGPDFNKRTFMGGTGLQEKIETVNGNTYNVFYGIHAVDGVGGTEFPYVGAEIVGPTYAYMLEFYNSGDPANPVIEQFINSFKAN